MQVGSTERDTAVTSSAKARELGNGQALCLQGRLTEASGVTDNRIEVRTVHGQQHDKPLPYRACAAATADNAAHKATSQRPRNDLDIDRVLALY